MSDTEPVSIGPGVFRADLRFELDGVPDLDELAGYYVRDMLVKIQAEHEPHPVYGILVDIEAGGRRRAPDSRWTQEEALALPHEFEKFLERQHPLYDPATGLMEDHGPAFKGLYVAAIPLSRCYHGGRATAQAQEALIREYIRAMRLEWQKLLELAKTNEGIAPGKDAPRQRLDCHAPAGRWTLLDSFLSNTFEGKFGDEVPFRYQTFVQWLASTTPSREADLLATRDFATRHWLPFEVGASYQIQLDWTAPYVTFDSADESKTHHSRESGSSPETFFPFHNFKDDFVEREKDSSVVTAPPFAGTIFTVPDPLEAPTEASVITLRPTGYTLCSVIHTMIRSIDVYWAKNAEALKEYHVYVSRLELIKQVMLGASRGQAPVADSSLGLFWQSFTGRGGVPGSGPYRGLDPHERRLKFDASEAEYGDRWRDVIMHPDTRGVVPPETVLDVVEPGSGTRVEEQRRTKALYQQQLDMGIADIERLRDLCCSVVAVEGSSTESRVNGSRNRKVAHLVDYLFDVVHSADYEFAHRDLWAFNTDEFGFVLYFHRANQILSTSHRAVDVYASFWREHYVESPQLLSDRAAFRSALETDPWGATTEVGLWFWQFDKVVLSMVDPWMKPFDEVPGKKSTQDLILGIVKWYSDANFTDEARLSQGFIEVREATKAIMAKRHVRYLDRVREVQELRDQKINSVVKFQDDSLHLHTRLTFLLNLATLVIMWERNRADGTVDFKESFEFWAQVAAAAEDGFELGRISLPAKLVGASAPTFIKFVGVAAGAIGFAWSAYETYTDFQGGDEKSMILHGAATVGAGLSVGYAALVFFGVIGTGGLGLALATIGAGIVIASSVIETFGGWIGATEAFCRNLMNNPLAEGGMLDMERFKKDFNYPGPAWRVAPYASLAVRTEVPVIGYDTEEFGEPTVGGERSKIDLLLFRVRLFIKDWHTFSWYR